jgi:hypothetical protein
MFTGKLTEHQMQDEHAKELENINQAKADVRPSPEVIKQRERIFIPVATLASVVMLVLLYLFISYEGTALTTLPRRVPPVQVFVPLTPTPVGSAPANAASGVPLPADHVGRTACLVCHANKVGPALPADHKDRTDVTCTACHKVGGAPAPAGTAAPTAVQTAAPGATAAPTKGATAAPTTGAATGPKPQPADHAGRTTCIACHANGVGPAEPADHAGRADASCSACHVPGSAPAGATAAPTVKPTAQPTGASAPGAATSAPGAQPTSAPATAVPASGAGTAPKPLPADHAGRVICNACHNNGVGPKEPSDHAGRADTTCTACHAPASAPTAQPTPAAGIGTPASASVAQTTNTASIAGLTIAPISVQAASTGANPEPANHAGRPFCKACHPVLEQLKLPANHVNRTTYCGCHSGLVPLPADHEGRTEPETCIVCHKAA